MKFFSILTLLLIAARLALLFFPDAPGEAATALTWACVASGAVAAVFIGVEIYCKVRGKGKKED